MSDPALNFIFLSDISQLRELNLFEHDESECQRIVTADIAIAFELERLGIEFIDEWDYISPNDIQANKNLAFKISKEISDDFAHQSESFLINLKDALNQDLVYAIESSLNAKTIYSKIFNKFLVKSARIFLLPQVGVVRTGPPPTSRAVNSVTQAILLYIAESRGIFVEKLISKNPLSFGRSTSLAQHFGAQESMGWDDLDALSKNLVFIYKTGMPEGEYIEVVKALKGLSDVSVLTLSQGSLESDSRNYVSLKLNPLWDSFLYFLEEKYSSIPEIFQNPHLSFQFKRLKHEIDSAYVCGDVFDSFLDLLNPSAVIFGHEAFTVERHLVNLSNSRKIPTLSLLHGGLAFKVGKRGLVGNANQVLVWNDVDIEWLTSVGVARNRLIKVGSIRYEKKYSTRSIYTDKNLKIKSKKKLGLDSKKTLIAVFTAEINTGMAAPIAEPSKHRQLIREVVELIKRRPDLNFIIKAHPGYDYYALYRELLRLGCENLIFDERVSLDQVISASDICLMINYCTTASLEAMIDGLPVVYIENAIYELDDWIDSLSDTKIPRVKTVSEFELIVNRIIQDKKYLGAILNESNSQIGRFLDIQDDSSRVRFLKEIESTIFSSEVSRSNFGGSLGYGVITALIGNDNNSMNTQNLEAIDANIAESMMFCLSYTCGAYRADDSVIYKIYTLFESCHLEKNWKYYKWYLMEPYISGRLNNTNGNENLYFLLKVFWIYVNSPISFLRSSPQFRKTLGKYVVSVSFSKMPTFAIGWIYKYRDKFY